MLSACLREEADRTLPHLLPSLGYIGIGRKGITNHLKKRLASPIRYATWLHHQSFPFELTHNLLLLAPE